MIRIHGSKRPTAGQTVVFDDAEGYEVIILSAGDAHINGEVMRNDVPYFTTVPLNVLAGQNCYIQTIRREG